jgi:hypothetical protein
LALATQAAGVDASEAPHELWQVLTPAPAHDGALASGAQSCAQVNESVMG